MSERGEPAAPPPETLGTPGTGSVLAVLGAFAALVVLRAPRLLTAPRFSAEEGSVYFQSALEHGFLHTLLAPHADYLVLYENVAVLAAAHLVPLETAPLVTTLAALLLQLVAPAIVLTSRAALWQSPWRRAAGVAALLFVQPSATVWLTTNTAAFHCAVVAFLILLEPAASVARPRRLATRGLLVLCGVTGPVSSFLLPAFVYRAWAGRERESRVRAALLGACAAVQIISLLVARARPSGLHRALVVDPGTTGFALLTRTVLQPVLGVGFAGDVATWIDRVGGALHQPVGILVGVGVVLVLARAAGKDIELRTHALALLALVVPTLLFATGSTLLDTRRPLIHPLVHDRYVYAPAVVLVLFALRQARLDRRAPARLAAAAVVLCALLNGFVSFRPSMRHHVHDAQPAWKAEVARYRASGEGPLRVWPASFAVRPPG